MNWSCIRNEQQYSLGVVLWQKKKQVSQKIERIISAHDSLSLLIIKLGGTCRNIQVQRGVVFRQTTLFYWYCNFGLGLPYWLICIASIVLL